MFECPKLFDSQNSGKLDDYRMLSHKFLDGGKMTTAYAQVMRNYWHDLQYDADRQLGTSDILNLTRDIPDELRDIVGVLPIRQEERSPSLGYVYPDGDYIFLNGVVITRIVTTED